MNTEYKENEEREKLEQSSATSYVWYVNPCKKKSSVGLTIRDAYKVQTTNIFHIFLNILCIF